MRCTQEGTQEPGEGTAEIYPTGQCIGKPSLFFYKIGGCNIKDDLFYERLTCLPSGDTLFENFRLSTGCRGAPAFNVTLKVASCFQLRPSIAFKYKICKKF
jgi:hypothetical protein